MASSGFGDDVEVVTESTKPPSTAAVQQASPKVTRRAGQSTKRTATNPAEALEILTSALEICRQSGIQIRMGKLTGKNMVGISLYPATVEINDGKHLIKPA